MKKILIFLSVIGLFAVEKPAEAQIAINATFLTAAISDTNATNIISLNSIGSGATAVTVNNIIFVDGEAMRVTATPTAAATVKVQRHFMSTPGQTHNSGAFVYYGPSQAFVSGRLGDTFYSGGCTASNNLYLPLIDVVNGWIGDCPSEGLWVWYQINPPQALQYNHHAVVNTAYTAKITDTIIAYTSITATRAVTLPNASGLAGKIYIIKDESGNAATSGTKTITIVGTVDGSSNPTAVNAAYGVYRIFSDGTNWFTW